MTATGGVAVQPLPPRPRRYRTLSAAVLETGAVLATAVRLMWRHWPALFALYFAGAAAREFSLIAAVKASKLSGALGAMVVILGPVATLVALVLMLRVVRPSLPWLAAATATDPARRTTLMDHLASALVPFLAVYASWGYLREDISNYLYKVWEDASFNDPRVFDDPGVIGRELDQRLPFNPGLTLLSVIVVAVLLRFLVNWWQSRRPLWVLGLLGAYLEVIWILVSVAVLNDVRSPLTDWVRDRKVVQWLLDAWNSTVDQLGPLTKVVRAAGEWLVGAIASADTVIVVPLAWLAVGAVVYGHKLAPPAPSSSELMQRASNRWNALPKPVRLVGTNVTADVRDRFTPLVHGIRVIARAGLAPMLFFCVAFLVAQTARDWMWEAERFLIGPRDLQEVWIPISGPLALLNDAVGVVLLTCLLGAAVDRVLRLQPPPPPAEPSEPTQPAGDAAGAPRGA